MRTAFRSLALLVLTSMLSGCGMVAGYVATDFSLRLEPQELSIPRNEGGEVTVEVDRIVPIDVVPLPVTVTLHRAPEGVSLAGGSEGVTIPNGVDSETLSVQVGAAVELGEHELVFRGTNGVRTKEARLVLTVEAAP